MSAHQGTRPVVGGRVPASAVAGLVLAVLFWPAGLLLSRQALRTSHRHGGRGLATAGVAISALAGVATVLLLVASAVGAARSGPVLTDGQSAACHLALESANRALEAYTSAGGAPLTGPAPARLAVLHGAGYLGGVPDIAGLGLDDGERFTGAC